jgi:hypothetical protein
MFSGQTEKALEQLRQSYAAYEDLADQVGTARLKIKWAQIMWYKELSGLSLFEEGLACLKEVGARRNVALWTVIFAMLKADEDIDVAAQTAIKGQELCIELRHQRGIAIAQGVLSRVALVKGHHTEAFERAGDYLHAAKKLALAVEYTDALVWIGWASLALGNNQQAERYVTEALQTTNYWRVACLDLAAVLLAHRSADNCEWAWQILGFAESRYARCRGTVSQGTLRRFLPQSMQDLPAAKIVELKEQGSRMAEEPLCRQLTAVLLHQT